MPCKHRVKNVVCPKCNTGVCFSCVQLEVHGCPGLAATKQAELETLAKKLVKVVAPKVGPV
jgi:hypothetical protein